MLACRDRPHPFKAFLLLWQPCVNIFSNCVCVTRLQAPLFFFAFCFAFRCVGRTHMGLALLCCAHPHPSTHLTCTHGNRQQAIKFCRDPAHEVRSHYSPHAFSTSGGASRYAEWEAAVCREYDAVNQRVVHMLPPGAMEVRVM